MFCLCGVVCYVIVCEFCCGTGLEIGKWDRAKVGDYTGIGILTIITHKRVL